MATHSSIHRGAWWAAVQGVAQSQTQVNRLSVHACIGEGNGNPLQYSCLRIPWTEEPGGLLSMGSHSRTRLKRLSSSSSNPPVYGIGNITVPISQTRTLSTETCSYPPKATQQ